MLMKYILVLHKKYFSSLKIFLLFDFLLHFYIFFLVWAYKFSFQDPRQKLIFIPRPYAEVNIYFKTLHGS